MTARKGKTAARHFVPDEKPIQDLSERFRLPPDKLRAVVSAFGPISKKGQRELLRCVGLALVDYWFAAKTQQAGSRRVTPSEIRKRLMTIEAAIRRLLNLFEINCDEAFSRLVESASNLTPLQRWSILQRASMLRAPPSIAGAIFLRLATAGINYGDWDEDRVKLESAAASERIAEALIPLMWLRTQTELAQQGVRLRKGSGGFRHRATPKGALIRNAINIYSHMRREFPRSGKKPGFGGPMVKFIKEVAHLAPAALTDKQIEEVWRARASRRK